MKSSTSLEARDARESCFTKRLLDRAGDRQLTGANAGHEHSTEDERWADLAASARVDWAAENPF